MKVNYKENQTLKYFSAKVWFISIISLTPIVRYVKIKENSSVSDIK